MDARPEGYLPAAGRDWLLPLYDPILRWVFREDEFKRWLVREAQIAPGARVLDLGCGTGTLTLLIKRLNPQSTVCGLDGDSKALALAKRKARREGLEVAFERGLSYHLPYPPDPSTASSRPWCSIT